MADSKPDEQSVFNAARRIDSPHARRAYLDEACGDGAVRARVEALLGVYDGNPSFLNSPAEHRPASGDGPGSVIGPYRLVEPLGEGGMGTVYLAEQGQPVRRQVALKIIQPGLDSRQVLTRFEAERQALALMDHPNIARVFDGGATTAGRPYFVMELVRGSPITSYCDERRLTPRQRLELLIPVCRAVQHAHQKGVIHRDIKPSNVLVAEGDGQPVPKVIDFGVAKADGARLTDATLETAFGTLVGTLEYMSPEQAEPGQLDIDTRTDVYSLGVLLYELLTGTTPFDRKRLKQAAVLEMLRVVREEEPPKPSTRLSTIAELSSVAANRGVEPRKLTGLLRGDLDWIVMKSLEKDRGRRYATAAGLAQDIERYLSGHPVEAGPPGASYRLGKFIRRHKPALAAASAFLGLLIVAVVVSTWQAVRATAAENKALGNEARAVAALRRADDEAAIARAVNEFLEKDLLGQADVANQPAGERDPDVTVRALLDRASDGIEWRFPGQAPTEAAIQFTLGKAYVSVGEYAKAQDHLTRSLALRREVLGGDHDATLQGTAALARVYLLRSRYREAKELFLRVLECRRARLGEDHPATMGALSDMGKYYATAGHPAQAESVMLDVLEARRARLGADHLDTLDTHRVLGLLCIARHDASAGESHLRAAVDGYRLRLGPDHPMTVNVAGSLAKAYMLSRRFAEAEPLLSEVIAASRAKHGPDHPVTLRALIYLAELFQEVGRGADAAASYEEVVRGYRAKLGPDHPDTAVAEANLAASYDFCGRHNEAEPLLQHALAARRAASRTDDSAVVAALKDLGAHYTRCGRLADAERHLLEAVTKGRSRLGPAHSQTQWAEACLATLRIAQNRPGLAEPVFREQVEYRRVYGLADSGEHAGALSGLAECLLGQGRYADAESAARDCLAIRLKVEPDGWSTFDARSALGAALAGQSKFAEAESHLAPAYEGLTRRQPLIPAWQRRRIADAADRLVQLYEAWGKPAEADKWRESRTRLSAVR